MQEMARGFSLFETLFVFEVKNPSIGWYTQPLRMQSVLLRHLRWEKKELLPRHHLIIFIKLYIELNPASDQSLCRQCHAWVKLQLAHCLLLLTSFSSTISHHSPSSSHQLFLPVHSIPRPVCQLLYCTIVLFKRLYCKILNVFFFVLVFYVLFV